MSAAFRTARPRPVGTLVGEGRDIYFRYAAEFLDEGYNLSPYHLAFDDRVQRVDTQVFEGLAGVFADSLPDGWGRLLTDRQLQRAGVALGSISPLDRLCIVGARGPGALRYRPVEYAQFAPLAMDTLDTLAEQSRLILAEEPVSLDQLAGLGGSSGGARPKVLVGYEPTTEALCPDAEVLPAGYEHYIVKFRSSGDRPDAARVELAYAHMARAAGLQVAECRLLAGEGAAGYFATRRFDRRPGGALHMISAAGLLHDNFRLSGIDYGHLINAANELTGSRSTAAQVLRLAAFNVYAYNRDDHSKNFAFLADANGTWQFAPAYDLTFSPSAHGEHSITVAGEGRSPGRKQLLALAATFEIARAPTILEEVREAVSRWSAFAKTAGVREESRYEIEGVLQAQLRT